MKLDIGSIVECTHTGEFFLIVGMAYHMAGSFKNGDRGIIYSLYVDELTGSHFGFTSFADFESEKLDYSLINMRLEVIVCSEYETDRDLKMVVIYRTVKEDGPIFVRAMDEFNSYSFRHTDPR